MDGVKEIRKGIEYDCYTDSIYDQPECPSCGQPMFQLTFDDIGKTVECPCCETKFTVTDSEWIRKYFENFTGENEKTEEHICMECGGKMTVHLIKRNGEWRTFSGECESCGLKFIV